MKMVTLVCWNRNQLKDLEIFHEKDGRSFAEGTIIIGNNNYYTYNIENMKEFEIR
jgi:hypothetical protein